MSFKLGNNEMRTINNVLSAGPTKSVMSTGKTVYSCNGCDGTCNMTCKGGCGSKYSNQGPTN